MIRLTFNIISDIHIGGIASNGDKFTYSRNVIDLGDNFEMKNIPKKQIDQRLSDYRDHKAKCHELKIPRVRCNHSVKAGKGTPKYYLENGILFVHGHHIFYKEKDIKKWENRKLGRGWFGRQTSKVIHACRGLRSMKEFSEKQEEKIEDFIEKMKRRGLKFHSLVFGHTHCDHYFVQTLTGVDCHNVPQGHTRITIEVPEGY